MRIDDEVDYSPERWERIRSDAGLPLMFSKPEQLLKRLEQEARIPEYRNNYAEYTEKAHEAFTQRLGMGENFDELVDGLKADYIQWQKDQRSEFKHEDLKQAGSRIEQAYSEGEVPFPFPGREAIRNYDEKLMNKQFGLYLEGLAIEQSKQPIPQQIEAQPSRQLEHQVETRTQYFARHGGASEEAVPEETRAAYFKRIGHVQAAEVPVQTRAEYFAQLAQEEAKKSQETLRAEYGKQADNPRPWERLINTLDEQEKQRDPRER